MQLDRGAEAKVWLETCGRGTPQSMAEAWDGGLSSAGILLLLSPDSIPQRLPREDWESLLKHVAGNAMPPVAALVLDECPYPRVLDRAHLFRCSDGRREVLRNIAAWAVGLHDRDRPAFTPARLPCSAGRETELDALWSLLVDDPGTVVLLNPEPGSGKSALAQEFARRARGQFRDILWVACGRRSSIAIANDVATLLGAPVERSVALLQEHRLLLVLDDVIEDLPIEIPIAGRTSVLITTQERDLTCPAGTRVIELQELDADTPACPAFEAGELRLLQAMSVCRPQSFPLALAARIANFDLAEARRVADRLATLRCIDPIDDERARFRIAVFQPENHSFRTSHAACLKEMFSQWRDRPAQCRDHLAEFEAAFEWSVKSDWLLARRLGVRGFAFLKSEGRLEEAARIYMELRDAAHDRSDEEVVDICTSELSWIVEGEGDARPAPASPGQLAFSFI